MKVNNEAYLRRMDERPSNQRKLKSLRQLNLGDRITRIMPSGNKTTDKLSYLQPCPYEVIEVEESGVDYLIRKICSSAEPIRCHIDFLNLFITFDLPADSEPKAPVAAKSTEYSAERIMGEKTHSARLGGESFLVEWTDSETGTKHECSWEPEENLTHCAQLMREWCKLVLTAQKHRLIGAKAIGINAVSMSERKLSDTKWLVVTDLS